MATWPPTPILTTDHDMEAEARDAMAASQQADAAIWSEHFGDRSIDEVHAELATLRALLARYRDETPLGHQPHMIAHVVDKALGRH